MTRAALALCVVLAWALARRVPSRRQVVIAATLTGLLAIDCGRPWLRPWLALNLAAFVAWYAVTAAGIWGVLKSEPRSGGTTEVSRPDRGSTAWASRPAFLGPAILLAIACLASSALALHFDRSAELARAAFALSLAAQLLAVARFAFRGCRPDGAQKIALIVALSSFVDAFGPWLFAAPDRDWHYGRWISVVTWSAVCVGEIWMLLRRRTA